MMVRQGTLGRWQMVNVALSFSVIVLLAPNVVEFGMIDVVFLRLGSRLDPAHFDGMNIFADLQLLPFGWNEAPLVLRPTLRVNRSIEYLKAPKFNNLSQQIRTTERCFHLVLSEERGRVKVLVVLVQETSRG